MASGRKRDEFSVAYSEAVLQKLGCPDVRRGEGTEEWAQTCGAYKFTPDLVAGPLVGGGHPSDFLIDVIEPSGDQFVNPLAKNPEAALVVLRALVENGSFKLSDIVTNHATLYEPLDRKHKKYSSARDDTPMVGYAIYFRSTGDQYVGPILAAWASLMSLDHAFGIARHLGSRTLGRSIRAIMTPGAKANILVVPSALRLAFVAHVVRMSDGPRITMIFNELVGADAFPFPEHPVVKWVRGYLEQHATQSAEERRNSAATGEVDSDSAGELTITLNRRETPNADG